MITSEQVKAARSFLNWSQDDLADKAKLSVQTIKRMESIPGELRGDPENVKRVTSILRGAGILLIPADAKAGVGVRLKK